MSKRSQKRRGAGRTQRPNASRPTEERVAGPGPSRRAVVLGAALGAVFGFAAVYLFVVMPNATHSGGPSPSQVAGASTSPSGSSATAASSSPSAGLASPSLVPGGKLAEAVFAALHANPFMAHVEESILASTITGGRRLTVTAKAVGDVSGPDAAVHTTGTGNGPATDEEIVAIGDSAWIKPKPTAVWEVHPRSLVAPSLDGLLAAIKPIDDPLELADVGIEDIDGVSLHHLTAVGAVGYQALNGVDGDYNSFDIWTTDSGSPVLVKATFSEFQGVDQITGSTEIRYSKVGGPITITPPSGAPTLAPSSAP